MQQDQLAPYVETASADRWAFLAPWTALLLEHDMRVKTTRIGDRTYRYQFDSISLNMQRNVMLDSASHDALQAMAEAVHLIAAALAMHPDAWTALVDQCNLGLHFDPTLHRHDELRPRFEFDCTHYPGDILMDKTGLTFFQVLLDSKKRTHAFHSAWRQLLALSDSTASCRKVACVPFKIKLSLWNEDQDIMLGFIDFARALKPFSPSNCESSSNPWSFVEAIELDWTGPETCSDLVKRTLDLALDAPFVQITTVTIDPKYVSCSAQELRELLATLTATYPRLNVRLGDVVPGSPRRTDYDSIRAEQKVALVMNAIASTPASIKYLNIGHLFTSDPVLQSYRQAVWNQLFGTVLSPTSKCSIKTLALTSPGALNVANDALSIQRALVLFPTFQKPTRLTLGLTRANQISVRAILSALGSSLRDVCLYDREQPIPSDTVECLLRLCPNLESLDLDNVSLRSMAMFYAPIVRCRISRLVLNNVLLQEPTTFATWLKQLGDTQSPVGRCLEEFVLARYGRFHDDIFDKLCVGHEHIQLIQKALHCNGRLHTLQLDVHDTVPRACLDRLMGFHFTPAAVRIGPLALRFKLALLSTMADNAPPPHQHRCDLSDDVLRGVFEFAAECLPRWVHVRSSWM